MRPRPRSSNRGQRPLSEKEALRLKESFSKKAVTAFIFSIFGICMFGIHLPFSIVGLVLSIIVRNGYRDRGIQKDSDLKLANAAFVCSIIGLVLGVFDVIILLTAGTGIVSALNSLTSLTSGGGYYGF